MTQTTPRQVDIGRMMRVEYKFAKLPNGKINPKRKTKERPVVVVGVKDDYYIVAPLSHERSQTGAGDIELTPEHRKAAKLDDDEGFIERGEYNIVHKNSSSIRKHKKSGEVFGGRLPPGVVGPMSYDVKTGIANQTLKARAHGDDAAAARQRAQQRAREHERIALEAQKSRDEERASRVSSRAQELIDRNATLSITSQTPKRPKLGIKSSATSRGSDMSE